MGVAVSTYPIGVSVGVDVAVGSGVILGNGVNVIVGVSVGGIGIEVKVALGAAVRVCALPVITMSGVSVAGTDAGDDSVVRHADAVNTVINAIKIGAFVLFMACPSGESGD